jgi:molybdate/tungstate transport system substrate-binding protein
VTGDRRPVTGPPLAIRSLTGLVLFALAGAPLAAQEPLRVFNAAALGPPFRQILTGMQAARRIPGFDHQNAPSLEVVRKLTELGNIPDLLAVADVALLDSLILPRFSSWYLVFGTNAMVIAYGPGSAYAREIGPGNWADVLLRPGVRIGRSDPRVDPSGYRTVMAVELAERWYRRTGLAERLLAAMPEQFMRRAEADLSALVQAGELDYIWTYRNLARAHRLQWVELPAEINLEDPALARGIRACASPSRAAGALLSWCCTELPSPSR